LQYDCSNVHRGFERVLLSRTAFETARCEVERANTSVADLPCVCGKQSHSATVYNVPMSICNSCASSLMRNNSNDNNDDDDDDDSAPAPPTFAVANGFAIGRLPPTLRDVRVHEAAMVAPSIVSGKTKSNNQQSELNNRIHHNHTDHNRLQWMLLRVRYRATRSRVAAVACATLHDRESRSTLGRAPIRAIARRLRKIVGFDSKHQRPLKGGGAFGVVHAYVGFIEAQDRDALRAHMVLWSLQQQLIGREQLDHRRHALDAAANAPLVGAEKLFDKLGLKMDTRARGARRHDRDGGRSDVRCSTVSRASCRAGEEARSQVRRAPRNARRGREHDVAGQFSFLFVFFVILTAKNANSVLNNRRNALNAVDSWFARAAPMFATIGKRIFFDSSNV
jgi:hypothetical protein